VLLPEQLGGGGKYGSARQLPTMLRARGWKGRARCRCADHPSARGGQLELSRFVFLKIRRPALAATLLGHVRRVASQVGGFGGAARPRAAGGVRL
jgi:hypothetical protein